jgi:DNA polymerase-3 subunit beta
MYCTIPIATLREPTRLLAKVVTRGTMPILQSVHLAVADAVLTVRATDLDRHLVIEIPLSGPHVSGTTTVPMDDLKAAMRGADKASSLTFNLTDTDAGPHLLLDSVRKKIAARRDIIPLDPDDFPELPEVTADAFILPPATISAIGSGRPFAATDDTRFVLQGVYLDPANQVVATDGRRMHLTEARTPPEDAIIPNPVVDLLLDPAYDGKPGVLKHDRGGSIASLVTGSRRIVFKTIDGNFPNWRQVVPPERKGTITFPGSLVPGLIDWLRGDKTGTAVHLIPGDGEIQLTRRVKDKADESITIAIASDGEIPEVIAFNGCFLADALVTGLHSLDVIDDMSPGVLTDGRSRCILIPMRTVAEIQQEEPDEEEETEEVETVDETADPEAIEVETETVEVSVA